MEIAKNIRMEVTGKKIEPSYHPEKKKERGFLNKEETIEETIKRVLQQEKGIPNIVPNGSCLKCEKSGHWARDCSAKQCYNCQETGHLARDCKRPEKTVKCYNCREEGHIFTKCLKHMRFPENRGKEPEINRLIGRM
jgi:hypothetical protein